MGKKITNEEFLIRVRVIHPEHYNFDQVEYVNAKTKVKVLCKNHGVFYMTPDNLSQGKGCKLCGYENTIRLQTRSFEDFEVSAKELYGDKYRYEKESYSRSQSKMTAFCTVHNSNFSVTPSAHLRDRECSKCGTIKSTSSKMISQQNSIIERYKAVHGNKYNYTHSKYKTMRSKTDIECYVHGLFRTTPHNHLNGQGCPKCSTFGYNRGKEGSLYVLTCDNIAKVGITNRNVSKRVTEINRSFGRTFKELFSVKGCGEKIAELEKTVLKFLVAKYKQPLEVFQGSTECFYDVNLPELINIIEREYGIRPIPKRRQN